MCVKKIEFNAKDPSDIENCGLINRIIFLQPLEIVFVFQLQELQEVNQEIRNVLELPQMKIHNQIHIEWCYWNWKCLKVTAPDGLQTEVSEICH